MNKIAIVVRVYDRIEDLGYCLQCIRRFWNENEYYVIVSFNGSSQGYALLDEHHQMADKVIELANNPGHLKGNSQLLTASIPYIPENSEYVVILEADTWLLDDAVVSKYCNKLLKEGAVWASAAWVEGYWNLALDFAVIDAQYLFANPRLFEFGKLPERKTCVQLLRDRSKFSYVAENMPVHHSSLSRKLSAADKKRINIFPRSKMLTHHIEDLEFGMQQKLFYANCLAG